MNDIIIPTAIEAHSERWTRFTQTAFVCLRQNSLSEYCQVSSRSTSIALPYTWSIWVFPWESLQKILRILKFHSCRSRTHLAVSTATSLVTNKQKLFVSIEFTFHCGPLRQSVGLHHHIVLITTSCVPLISFQPPLPLNLQTFSTWS